MTSKPNPTAKLAIFASCGAICLFGHLLPASQAATIRVPADQPTIQQAIDAAVNGDRVLVSTGKYAEHVDYHGKALWIQSTDGPLQTIIDGQNSGTVVTIQNQATAPQSLLGGFT